MLVVFLFYFSLLFIFLAVCNETCRLKCSLAYGKLQSYYFLAIMLFINISNNLKEDWVVKSLGLIKEGQTTASENVSPIFPNINPHHSELTVFSFVFNIASNLLDHFATIIWKAKYKINIRHGNSANYKCSSQKPQLHSNTPSQSHYKLSIFHWMFILYVLCFLRRLVQ